MDGFFDLIDGCASFYSIFCEIMNYLMCIEVIDHIENKRYFLEVEKEYKWWTSWTFLILKKNNWSFHLNRYPFRQTKYRDQANPRYGYPFIEDILWRFTHWLPHLEHPIENATHYGTITIG